MNQILLYSASALTIVWGIAHLFPSRSVVVGFGEISADNTKTIAQAIADAIRGDVKLLHAGDVDASELGACDLLIVGAPTHGGRASEPAGNLLEKIQTPALAGTKVAAFDTRLTWWWIRLFGFAAPKIARSLEKKGGAAGHGCAQAMSDGARPNHVE